MGLGNSSLVENKLNFFYIDVTENLKEQVGDEVTDDNIASSLNIFHVSGRMRRHINKIPQNVNIVLLNLMNICDMIKRKESDVGDVVFEILAKTVFKFLCFILFLALSNPS